MAIESPYLLPGRLADVIAALQVMGAGLRPENEIAGWAQELSGSGDPAAIARWTAVFADHQEFFLTYFLPEGGEKKAALRLRYVNKFFDARTNTEYTPEQKDALPPALRDSLTSKPLTGDAVAALMKTALDLKSRANEDLAASRFWVPLAAATPGFFGAIIGAAIAVIWGVHRS